MSSVSVVKMCEARNVPFGPIQKPIQITFFSEIVPMERIVKWLAGREGALDLYCWYEGGQGLPVNGARFLKKELFAPLYAVKKEARLFLYSLKAWDFAKSVSKMANNTPLGRVINRINQRAVECIYSYSFFRWCAAKANDKPLISFISDFLPANKRLIELSRGKKGSKMKVEELFDKRSSLLDCLAESTVTAAYAQMQWVEGFYLVQESVQRGLMANKKRIQIAFVLPNDESKYHIDFPRECARMLEIEFGEALRGVEIDISFNFFAYGDSIDARPYCEKGKNAEKVPVRKIGDYFDYLKDEQAQPERPSEPFLRDVIHNLNGGI